MKQELLSGIRNPIHALSLREALGRFAEAPTVEQDFEDAAIFTADQDFARFATVLPVTLHALP